MFEDLHERGVDPETPYIERLRSDRKKDNLEEIIFSSDYSEIEYSVSNMKTSQLKEALSQFSVKEKYPDKLRALFFFLNEELTCRNISPSWRDIVKVKYKDSTKMSLAKQRYARDIQIMDLHWLHAIHYGHKVDNTAWEGLYSRIFEKELFDFEQADNIANADFTAPQKIKGMKLRKNLQLQLSTLRSDTVTKQIRRAVDASNEVEMHIHDAADRNPRKGKKVSVQAEDWSKIWLCRKLAGSSPRNIANMYYQMTGNTINLSVLRNKMDKIAAALHDVKSPHYRSMFIKK